MQYSAALLAILPSTLASTIRIDVGHGGLVFAPNKVTASPGDILEFHYFPMNHSVTQSNFANPCVPLANGFNSGFVPVNNATIGTVARFDVVVIDTKPIWVYCQQGKHCASGMSMVVNEPKTKNTLEAYQLAASNVTKAGINPNVPVGGFFSTEDATSSTTHAPWMTYTSSYSTYSTVNAGATTTVTLVETVTYNAESTATPGSDEAGSGVGSGGSSPVGSESGEDSSSDAASSATISGPSTVPSAGAASSLTATGWFVAVGAISLSGLLL